MKSTLHGMKRIGCWCPHTLVAVILVSACSGGGAAPADAGPGGNDATAPDPNQDIGHFQIQLVPAVPARMDLPATPAQTALLGRVRTGATPSRVVWRTTAQEGPCRLVEPELPFCTPSCLSGEICAEGGRCLPEPGPRSAGPIQIQGLRTEAGPQDVTVQPEPPQFDYQLPTGLRLAYPPFPPDATVRLSAAGGDLGPFALATRAIAPLEFPAGATPVVRKGSGFALRWTAPPAGATSLIEVAFDLSLHAGTKGKIECEVPDTGALDVSGVLMDKLIALGTAGYPKVVVTRRSRATTSVPAGRLALSVFCEIDRELMVEGQTSCTEDAECPAGRKCNLDKLLCE